MLACECVSVFRYCAYERDDNDVRESIWKEVNQENVQYMLGKA